MSAVPRRLSLRLRLTLLYGACFLLAAAAVLAVTYVLVAQATNDETQRLRVHGTQTQSPSYPPTIVAGKRQMLTLDHIFLGGTEITTWIPSQPAVSPRTPRKAAPGKRPNLTQKPSPQLPLSVLVDTANGALKTQRSHSLGALLTWSGVSLGVMAVVSILLGWLLAGRALRPLRTMSSRAREITEENLHERLSADTQEDELGELANTFDGVLARLERAFEAQKRFVANASHELRTPVTLERALLETALSNPDADADELRHVCERVLVSTEQQQRMIEALLALARSQGGTNVDAPVNLADLAQDAITLREQRLEGLTLATDLHPAPLTGDPALLERLVANLIDNAIVHNLAGDAWITVETGRTGVGSWLRVSNSGPEIPEWMISELFEPFRRMDGERTATATGLGLGLSIVRAIADVHRAAVEVRPVDGGGLRVEVRF
ncbi:MAG: sensor histidine kinase [Solirubrobacteraceae bacterium]